MKNTKKNVKIVLLLLSFMSILLIGIGGLGLLGMKSIKDGLQTVYLDRVIPLVDIKAISDSYNDILHTTHRALAGKIDTYKARVRITRAVEKIDIRWKKYKATYLAPEEKKLITEIETLQITASAPIGKLLAALQEEDKQTLANYTLDEIYTAVDPIITKLSKLEDVQFKVTKEEYDKADISYIRSRNITIVGIVFGLLMAIIGATHIVSGITKSMNEKHAAFQKYEEGLNKSEERFRMFFDNAPDAVFIADIETGTIVDANPSATTLLMKPKEEIIGMHQSELHPHEGEKYSKETFKLHIVEAKKGTLSQPIENKVVRADGSYLWVEVNAQAITIENKEYLLGVFRDITKRKKAEAELDNFFNISRDMLCIADTQGYFKRINPMFEITLGFTAGELMSRPFVEFIHPDDRQNTLDELIKLSQGIPTIYFENRYICKDGTYKDLAWTSSPESGMIYATARDITERKKIEEEVRVERDKLNSIMNTIDDGIYITNKNCELQYVNPVVEREFGAILGRKCYEYFHDKSEQCPWCRRDEVLSGKTIHWEWDYPRNEKTYHRYDTPINNKDGSVSKFALFHDITELKKAERQIMVSLKEKEMLVGEIHHRVKNNLAIISSLLRMQSYYIKDGNTLRIFKETENRIKSISTVHDMLYRSKDMASVDFKQYINRLIKTLYDTYRDNLSGIKLTTDVEDVSLGIDLAIPCGLLINELLTNAVKYAFPDGKTGEVYIGLHPASGGVIELIVRDNGIGFPETLDIWNTQTLGFQLITGITQTQLEGNIEMDRTNGTQIKVRFKAREQING
ncbi:MAG: PAS domain S-box protein [Nitrospirae bacterium]|nr:PAS domain S-box protein [Nitrospirota bacterium]